MIELRSEGVMISWSRKAAQVSSLYIYMLSIYKFAIHSGLNDIILKYSIGLDYYCFRHKSITYSTKLDMIHLSSLNTCLSPLVQSPLRCQPAHLLCIRKQVTRLDYSVMWQHNHPLLLSAGLWEIQKSLKIMRKLIY